MNCSRKVPSVILQESRLRIVQEPTKVTADLSVVPFCSFSAKEMIYTSENSIATHLHGHRTMIALVILEWENSQGCCNDGVIYAVCAVRVIHSSLPHTSHPAMSAQLQNCTTLLMPLVIRPGNTQLCRLMGLPLQFQQSYITPHVGLLGSFITC